MPINDSGSETPGKVMADKATLQLIAAADKLEEKLKAAQIDTITGLPKISLFVSRLDAYKDDRRSAVTILMIDINNLKTVNDTAGHSAGNKLIKRVGDFLTANSRKEDTVARLGGDEFGVIDLENLDLLNARHKEYLAQLSQTNNSQKAVSLQDFSKMEGNAIKSRFLAAMDEYNQLCRDEGRDSDQISFSIGISTSLPPHNLVQTVNDADTDMYEMKRQFHQNQKIDYNSSYAGNTEEHPGQSSPKTSDHPSPPPAPTLQKASI